MFINQLSDYGKMKLEELRQAYLFEYANLDIAKKLVANCSCGQTSSHDINFRSIKGGCGICPVCKMIENGSYPNMLTINSADAIGIDAIRTIRNFTALKPCYDKKNYIIIDCKNGITIVAQNALLKMLEEPPDGSYFFMIGTRKSYLIPTVLSRLIVINEYFGNGRNIDEELKSCILKKDYNELLRYTNRWNRNRLGYELITIAKESSLIISEKLINAAILITTGNSNIKLTLFELTKH